MKEFFDFIDSSVTSFNAVDQIEKLLINNNYELLDENKKYCLEKNKKYYIKRNGTSIIACNIGGKLDNPSLQICASHSDCPSLKIKPEAFIVDKDYLKLNTEVYGGAILYPWLDRPLSVAGRILVKEDDYIISKSFLDEEVFCVIPSLAIHQNREINKDLTLNPQIDLNGLVSLNTHDFKDYLQAKSGINKENILGFDLYLYPLQKAYNWGLNKEFISSFHIDNIECAYTSLKGFINNFNENNINIYACFDSEEVGSLTRQGADSDFLETTISRISESLNIDYYNLIRNGMMLSCDNGHALHPNHPEKSDPVNRPLMNKGVVIKYNAAQSYTSDGLSSSLFKDLLDRNNIKYQYFANRSDIKGGSTLGNISNRHISLITVDIGLAQLSMHSILETAGSEDLKYMIDATTAFYKAHLNIDGNKYSLR